MGPLSHYISLVIMTEGKIMGLLSHYNSLVIMTEVKIMGLLSHYISLVIMTDGKNMGTLSISSVNSFRTRYLFHIKELCNYIFITYDKCFSKPNNISKTAIK